MSSIAICYIYKKELQVAQLDSSIKGLEVVDVEQLFTSWRQ